MKHASFLKAVELVSDDIVYNLVYDQTVADSNWKRWELGFRYKGQLTYHWFKMDLTTHDGETHEYIRHDHSYSQRTGKVNKGTFYGLRIKWKIEEIAKSLEEAEA